MLLRSAHNEHEQERDMLSSVVSRVTWAGVRTPIILLAAVTVALLLALLVTAGPPSPTLGDTLAGGFCQSERNAPARGDGYKNLRCLRRENLRLI